MYLIEIPKRVQGVYAIINIITGKAYVGLAENLANRTRDHFNAICNRWEDKDNKFLIKEENPEFIHFYVKTYSGKTKHELEVIESILMCLTKDLGFELYNIAKRSITKQQILNEGMSEEEFIHIYDELKCCYNDRILSLLEPIITEATEQYKNSILEYIMSIEPRRKIELWKLLGTVFFDKTKQRFVLNKKDGTYAEDDFNYYKTVNERLRSFVISKEKARNLGLNWKTESLLNPKFNLNQMTIISNFGTHNGEAPYEILLKMDLDLRESSDGCCYWALKNLKETAVREIVDNLKSNYLQSDNVEEQKGCKKQPNIYALFKTTPYDNSKGLNEVPGIEKVKTEKEIIDSANEKKKKNLQEWLHSYRDENGKWTPLPLGLTYPNISNSQYKSVALKIKEFYFCKESFDFKRAIKDKYFLIYNSENNNPGSNPSYIAKICEDKSTDISKWKETDDTECIIAQLEYPYVVEVSHIPTFSQFLLGIDDGESTPVILLEAKNKKMGNTTQVLNTFAFEEGKVWYCDVEKGVSYENFKNYSNIELCKRIKKEDGTKGRAYTLYLKDGIEYIDITPHENEESIKLSFDTDYDPIKEHTWKVIKNDYYKYYGFPEKKTGHMWSFRYFTADKNEKTPPFVFDKEFEKHNK